MGLGTFKQFTAGTKAVADDVNHNFDVISTWANGNITSDNIGQLNDVLQFNLTTDVNGITISNSGDKTSLKITQSDELDNGESVIEIDNSTIDQLGTDSADLKIKAKSSSTISSIHVLHGATDTLKLTKSSLNLLNNTTLIYSNRIKLPVQTTTQRNAIVSPEEGSIIYNSTTQTVEVKNSIQWQNFGNPIGSMVMFAGSIAPSGWLLCEGQEVSQSTYSNLYSIVGSSFNTGGEAIGNFRLPDMRRKVPMGSGGTGTATIGNSLGNTGGSESFTLSQSNLPNISTSGSGSHYHSLYSGQSATGAETVRVVDMTNKTGQNIPGSSPVYLGGSSTGPNPTYVNQLTNTTADHTHSLGGSSTPVSTIQPALIVNYIIKY